MCELQTEQDANSQSVGAGHWEGVRGPPEFPRMQDCEDAHHPQSGLLPQSAQEEDEAMQLAQS